MINYIDKPKVIKRAKELRQSGSIVERILWRALRDSSKNKNFKFRYQHPVSKYIVDFACLSAKLVIEVDGPSHDAMVDYDKERQQFIESKGYKVIRFSNHDVMSNLNGVVMTIVETVEECLN